MTEKEAKVKWCPHAREVDSNSNGMVSHNHNTLCIASDCMMWQYDHNSIAGMRLGDGYCGLSKRRE